MDQVAKNEEIHRLHSRFNPQGHTSLHPRYVASASGAVIRDVEGWEYIDFAGGIGVMNVGMIRTLMPLTITDEHLERGLAILADGLKSLGR
jgi:4-aminobutyrate aminotransferase/(S)-3-amino-2-methylpropionate transaminase